MKKYWFQFFKYFRMRGVWLQCFGKYSDSKKPPIPIISKNLKELVVFLKKLAMN
jgi:hypothetical protein